MKFDIKNYASLQLIAGVPITELNKICNSVIADKATFDFIKNFVCKGAPYKLYGMTDTFLKSILKSYDKLYTQVENLIPLIPEGYELFIHHTGISVCYIVSDKYIFIVSFKGLELDYAAGIEKESIRYTDDINKNSAAGMSMVTIFSHHRNKQIDKSNLLELLLMDLLVLMFKHFCETDEIILYPKQQKLFHTAYTKNSTPFKITVLDSTWLNTLIKSDAFLVRGHFRLQSHGEGRSKRKLIWISEFQKDGYTRVAGKLKEDERKK